MHHIELRCLEGSTPEAREGLSLFIALRWMQEPERVMMWVTENIQACLRIFWQAQHQWLARNILHQPQGGLFGFCLAPNTHKQIRPIRLIRGKIEIQRTGASPPGVGNRCGSMGAFLYCQRQPFCFLGA